MPGKLFELTRWLWLEARLGTPPFVQRTAMPRLHEAKEFARIATKPYFTLCQWQGENDGGSLAVTYAGLGYAGPILKSLLFSTNPSEEKIGRVPMWRLEDCIAASTSDIVIIETSKHLIRKLPHQSSIVLPFRLQFILDTQGEWDEVENRFRRDARRNEVRKAKKFSYQYDISHSKTDLEMFYHQMYQPTMKRRHGELAAMVSKREAYQLLRHGLLFLVKRDGIYVSGGLCRIEQGVLRFREMGVLDGDQQLMREGAVGAMNYLRVCWAHQAGCRGVNFGECWPYMPGIFQSKRKWGATVSIPAHEHKQIWIRIQRNTPAVSLFLENNPCVIVDEKGKLQGLIITSDPENVTAEMQTKCHKLYATPGLETLLIRSTADLIKSQ